MKPNNVNPVQWSQAMGYARQTCARIYRDGGSPRDALRAFGLFGGVPLGADWDGAVQSIAESLCSPIR